MRTVGSLAISEGCGGWRFLFSELPEFVGDLDAGRLVLPGFGGVCSTPCGSVGDPRFGLKAQTIGDPIGVRIVGDNLDYVEDVTIREAGGSQGIDIGVIHRARRHCQFDRETQHGHPLWRQRCSCPVVFNRSGEFVVSEQPTQTAPVVDYSIVAVVLEAHDHGDDLALDLAERCGPGHGRFVQTLVGRHAAGVKRVHGEDVVDPAVGRINNPRMKLTECAVPRVVGNDLDACHKFSVSH